MIRRVSALCLLLFFLCFQVLSETTSDDMPVGLQIGKRFISGPLIVKGGNETITIDKLTIIKSLTINDTGVFLESYPNTTEISIFPEYIQLNEIGSFGIQIYIVPSQPIKGVEINMSFNPSQLQIVNVTEGNLFGGYPTFFVVHKIDNVNGFLVTYDLIIGQGNTSNAGNFVSVAFNATERGVSSLNLNSVGICNETQYIGITIKNATLYIAYPWDVVPDRNIDIFDISSLILHYKQSGSNGWIRDDINNDGHVDILDVSVLIYKYGEKY